MIERRWPTQLGTIHYWVSPIGEALPWLVMLPGLTADHHLFDRQVEAFEGRYNLLVWDAPGHAESRPFDLSFTLADKACWLHDILRAEGIASPVLVGQSMGGYLAQMYLQLYPGRVAGVVIIDSAPLQRHYYSRGELWLLKRVRPVYKLYPWRALVRDGAAGCAVTPYGRELMTQMMMAYHNDPSYYCSLVGHGYGMLAEAVERNLEYRMDCPLLLLCGENDRAGRTRSYNRGWSRQEGHRLEWIPKAGHNANSDNPELVNRLIEEFVGALIGER